MSKHRSLVLATFIEGVPPDLLERYFAGLASENRPAGWALLNADALMEFLNAPDNEEARGAIIEELRRVNDICADGMNLLVRAHERFGLPFKRNASAQEIAMRLYVDHKDAFEFAWTRYLLYGSSGKMSRHRMPINGAGLWDGGLATFKEDIEEWFAGLAKGSVCQIHCVEDTGEHIIRISRGSYMRTVACWEGESIGFKTFRPASEDLLVYDSAASTLSIKAGIEKERQRYLQAFARHLAGDEGLADRASRNAMFSLLPLQASTFNYDGSGAVTKVDLVKVRLRLPGPENAVVDVKSEDVRATLQNTLPDLSLASGELLSARFRFQVHVEGHRPQTVAFDIEPPSRTDLAQKKYADIIEAYLAEQGVKLL